MAKSTATKSPAASKTANASFTQSLSCGSEDEESMAEDDDLHDYSEEEINSLWREKAMHVDEEYAKKNSRRLYLQLIFWENNRITWEAYDSPHGNTFPEIDAPHIRVDEVDLPASTLFRQWVLNENLEWLESSGEIVKLLRKKPSLHRGGIVGVYQFSPPKKDNKVAAKAGA